MASNLPKYKISNEPVLYDLQSDTLNKRFGFTTITSKGEKNKKSWIFPLTKQIRYKTSAAWNGIDTGWFAVDLLNGMSDTIGTAVDSIKSSTGVYDFGSKVINAAQPNLTKVWNRMTGEIGAARLKQLAMKKLGLLVGGDENTWKAYNGQNKRLYNDNRQLYFDGVDFRSHSFSFDLTPMNATDSANFATMINEFKYAMTPGYTADKYYFTYPALFDIGVCTVPSSGNYVTLLNITNCACTDFEVSTGDGGEKFTYFSDGRPTSYTVSFEFKESELPTSDNEGRNNIFASNFNAATMEALEAQRQKNSKTDLGGSTLTEIVSNTNALVDKVTSTIVNPFGTALSSAYNAYKQHVGSNKETSAPDGNLINGLQRAAANKYNGK